MSLQSPVYKMSTFFAGNFGTHLLKASKRLHSHDYWEIFYAVQGTCNHYLDGAKQEISRGSLCILKPYVSHAFDDVDDTFALHRDIAINSTLFEDSCNSIDIALYDKICMLPNLITFPIDEATLIMLENRLNKFNHLTATEHALKTVISKLIVNILLLLLEEYTLFKNDSLNASFNIILAKMQTPEVLQGGIPFLLGLVNFSHGYLCQIFKQNTGLTLIKQLTIFRMQHASAMLRNSDSIIIDIAAQVGFESISHFIKTFKQTYHMTPKEYKNQFNFTKSKHA